MKKLLLLLPLVVTGCIGFCSAAPGESEVTLYVSDAATGRAVAAPTFSADGSATSAVCGGYTCLIRLEYDGATHAIVVGAPGYRQQTIEVSATMDSIHLAVELVAL